MIKKLLLLFLDCALIALAVLGGLLCLCSAFSLTLPREVGLLVLLCAPLLCALFRLKKSWIAALAVLAVLALAVWYLFDELKLSFVFLLRRLFETYQKGYHWLDTFYKQLDPGIEPGPAALFPALTALAVLQTYFLSLSLSCWKRTLPGAVFLLLTVAPCFVLRDTPPKVEPLLIMTFAVLVMVLTQGVRRRAESEAPAAMGIAAIGAGLLLALLLWLFPFESYKPPVQWQTITDEFDRIGAELDSRGNDAAGLNGSARSVSLKKLSRLSERRSLVLYVQSNRSGLTYLRALAFSAFDGERWDVDARQSWNAERLFPALGLRGDVSMRIKTSRAESVIFTPYELTALPNGSEAVSDAYLGNTERKTEYSISAGQSLPTSLSMEEDAQRYRAWVAEACLELPEETRRYLLDWWRENGLPGVYGLDYGPAQVAERISRLSRYSRSPELCPSERDFCDWFLNDAETGYCVHYATCLTAMLRALGQPARYVSGYVFEAAAGERVEVTSINAHAWTEYYDALHGRWIPADATPRNATEFTGVTPEEDGIPLASDDIEPLIPTRPRPSDRSDRDGDTAETTEPPAPRSADEPPAQPPADEAQWELPLWLKVLLGVLLLLALLVLRRFVKRSLRARKFAAAEPNRETVLLWKRYQKLRRCLRQPPETQWLELANKAAFSQHQITEQELVPLRKEVGKQELILYWSGFAKRLYYCYIRAII